MNGYIARLIRQSGVKIADDKNQSAAMPAPARTGQETVIVLPGADLIEQEVQHETEVSGQRPVPAAGAHEMLVRPAVDNEPDESRPYAQRHHEDKAGLEKPLATQRKDTSPASVAPESNVVFIGEMELRGVPEQRAAPVKTADSLTQPHTSDSAVAVPSSTEIVQEVLAWMADSDGATERVKPTVSGAPSSPALPVQVVAAGSSTQRQFGTEPWSVHIDTIHLTIEEPPAKPEPRSVEPRAVPAAQPSQSRFSPSRLRRHYVRTF